MRTTNVSDALRGYRLFLDRHSNSGDPINQKTGLSPHQFAADFMSSPEFFELAAPRLLNGSQIAPKDLNTWAISLFDVKLGVEHATHWLILYSIGVDLLRSGAIANAEIRGRLTRLLNLTSRGIKNAAARSVDDHSARTGSVDQASDVSTSVFLAMLGRMPTVAEQNALRGRTITATELAAQIAVSEEFRNSVVFPTLISVGDTRQLEDPSGTRLNAWCAEAFGNPDCHHATIRAHRIAAILRTPSVLANLGVTDGWRPDVLAETLLALPHSACNRTHCIDLLPKARTITNIFELFLGRVPESLDVYIHKWRLSAADLVADVASGQEFGSSIIEPLLAGTKKPHGANDYVRPSLAAWAWLTFGIDPPSTGPSRRFGLLSRILRSPDVALSFSQNVQGCVARSLAETLERSDAGNAPVEEQPSSSNTVPSEYLDVLASLFSSADYCAVAGIGETSAETAWRHYLDVGMRDDKPPSLLFSVDFLKELYPARNDAAPLAIRWLDDFFATGQPSTPLFDTTYYTNAHSDLAAAPNTPCMPFLHYLRSGRYEGRNPNATFDHDWYVRQLPIDGLASAPSAFEHFLTTGLAEGLSPRQTLLSVFGTSPDDEKPTLADYELLCRTLAPFSVFLTETELDLLLGLWAPSSESVHPIRALTRWLAMGLVSRVSPSPLFDEDIYIEECAKRGVAITNLHLALVHFLSEGRYLGAVPTRIVDVEIYLACNPDLPQCKSGAFEHFVRYGIYEGRSTRKREISDIALAYIATRREMPGLRSWRRFWSLQDVGVHVMPHFDGIGRVQDQVKRAFNDPDIIRMLARAAEIDPAARLPAASERVYAAPIHDPREVARRRIRGRLKRDRYDTIVCLSGVEDDAATDVATALTKALQAIFPGQDVLLLLTDGQHFKHRSHLPPDVELVDVSDVLEAVGETQAEYLLYTLLVRFCSNRVIALGSRLCWSMFRRFGERMPGQFSAYGYLLGKQPDAHGVVTNIFRDHFGETACYLDGVLTESDYLRDALLRTYRPPLEIAARMTAVYCRPSLYNPQVAPPLRTSARHIVGWTGSSSEIGSFGLIREIASRMSDVDFECWFDVAANADVQPAPLSNIYVRMIPMAESTPPLAHVDIWLSTTVADGVSPAFLAAALTGKAVVARLAGAVSDMITDQTGWPVHNTAEIQDYVDAIRQALTRPDQRASRGHELRESVAALYDAQRFAARLSAALKQRVPN